MPFHGVAVGHPDFKRSSTDATVFHAYLYIGQCPSFVQVEKGFTSPKRRLLSIGARRSGIGLAESCDQVLKCGIILLEF